MCKEELRRALEAFVKAFGFMATYKRPAEDDIPEAYWLITPAGLKYSSWSLADLDESPRLDQPKPERRAKRDQEFLPESITSRLPRRTTPIKPAFELPDDYYRDDQRKAA
jgi:hypothetical protein